MPSAEFWMLPSTLAHSMEVAKLLCYGSIGLILADTIRFASFDLALIRNSRNRRWPQIPYLLARPLWYLYATSMLILLFTPREVNCQALMNTIEAFMGLVRPYMRLPCRLPLTFCLCARIDHRML